VWGYYEKLATLEDPEDEMYEEVVDWMPEGFDPQAFDREKVNEELTSWWEQE
jgi:hypothetical protein